MNIHEYREEQRLAMLSRTKRSPLTGLPVCHLCNTNSGAQMHELINRAQTSSNKKALQISFSEELCSWLCPNCHAMAPSKKEEAMLWKRNITVYGYDRVMRKLRELEKALGFWPIGYEVNDETLSKD